MRQGPRVLEEPLGSLHLIVLVLTQLGDYRKAYKAGREFCHFSNLGLSKSTARRGGVA